MIKVENIKTSGWEAAFRGMRNPLNSHNKSDSTPAFLSEDNQFHIGKNDFDLATRLIKAGSEHRKFLRMIHVSFDVTAPIFWLLEFDTYKIGTTSNGTSKMHKLMSKEFTIDDFSWEETSKAKNIDDGKPIAESFLELFNYCRDRYIETKDKQWWRILIEILPESYNQRRTFDCSMETILNILHQRKGHKLDEWEVLRQAMFDNVPYCKEFYDALYGKENNND